MSLHTKAQKVWRLKGVAALLAALVMSTPAPGFGAPGASASVTAVRTDLPATSCASRATGPVTDAFKLAVCSDLVADLAGLARVLGLPVLAPTGSVLTSPVKVDFATAQDPANPSAYMDTNYFHPPSPLVNFFPCAIRLFPSAYETESQSGISVSAKIHILLVHEAVHCYQNSVITFDEAGGNAETKVPQWMSEGLATYVATLYTGYAEPATPSFWVPYGWLGNTTESLQSRNYDAVGWYWLVKRVTENDLTSKIVPAWQAWVVGGPDAFLKTLGGDDPAVGPAWAPSLLHSPQWGDGWDTPGIGIPTDAQPAEIHDNIAAQDVPYQVQIAPYSAVVDRESTVKDGLIEISIDNGFASVHDNGTADAVGFKNQIFCLKNACDDTALTCPGTATPLKPIPLTVPFVVAVGGSPMAGMVTMDNISGPKSASTPLELPASAGTCKPTPLAKTPKPAFSDGDPHIQALDGGTYDFQGAGEYTLVRSASGDVDVQVRAAPAAGSKTVAWNTAVAMRVVSTDVEVDVGEPLTILVNGKRIALPTHKGHSLDGGGRLTYISNGVSGDVIVTWPDGSQLDVFADRFAENATFTPPAAGVDSFSGLLSAFVVPRGPKKTANTSSETLLGGDGHSYVVNPLKSAGFKVLYGPFADSWRVTPKTSLFTYRKGKSTSSFDVKGFPARFETFAAFPAAKRKSAAAACKAAGVTKPKLLADCELDVDETGHAELEAAASRPQPGGNPTPTVPSSGGGGSDHQPPGSGAIHPVSYYFSHPCDVLTNAEISQVLGYSTYEYVSVDSVCPIRSGLGDHIEFSHQSEERFKSLNPGSAGSGPVPSLGHDAYCINSPVSALTQAFVVLSLGPAGSLRMLAENCTNATALTKYALARISGI
jgi:von Willebrand factor type D domain